MHVEIAMLGTFSVAVARAPVAADAWSRRGAASLVKLLALAEGRSLHREQVIDALWPTVPPDAALPRLHKAAHYARRALEPDDAHGTPILVLRQDRVLLLPDVRRARRRRRVPPVRGEGARRGLGVRGRGRAGGVRRAAAARGPLRAVGGRLARHRRRPAPRPAAAGRAVVRAGPRGPDRRGGARGAGPGARAARRRTRGRAPAGADGAVAASRAGHGAQRRGAASARGDRGAGRARPPPPLPSRRSGWSGARPSATPCAATSTAPTPGAAAPCCWPGRPASASPRCSTWPSRWPSGAAGGPPGVRRR